MKSRLRRSIIAGSAFLSLFAFFPQATAADLYVYETQETGFVSNYPVLKTAPPAKDKRRSTVSQEVKSVTLPSSKMETPSDCPSLIWPVNAPTRLSQGFSGGHAALDISYASSGNRDLPIIASAAGKVIQAAHSGWNGGYGNVVVIDHGNGWLTRYGHNSKVLVEVGQEVTQGQQIAVMGNTGRVHGVTGIHVHWEAINNGKRINPNTCLR